MENQLPESTLIRQEKRRYRQALSPIAISQASMKARHLLRELTVFQQAQTVAIYYPAQGELDPLPLLESCGDKRYALPLILTEPHNHLHFYCYDQHDILHANKFGIEEPEPVADKRLQLEDIDLILVPMVAFDESKNRMGHGAGFYDRTLALIREAASPCLVGFAYEWQKVESLPAQPWDVPMDLIVTGERVYR